MPFGAFSSTMIFFTPISMASSSNAKTVWSVEFIPAYSHTQQITQRSKWTVCIFTGEVNQVIGRVLLATIRDKGNCPCPRCLVQKEQLNNMGQKRDIKFRLKNQRKFLLNQIQTARSWIYEKAQSITSQVVERLLKPSSSVPTMVCFIA
jgi:hypothetical protein